jgi:hypothetical protein
MVRGLLFPRLVMGKGTGAHTPGSPRGDKSRLNELLALLAYVSISAIIAFAGARAMAAARPGAADSGPSVGALRAPVVVALVRAPAAP